MDLTELEDNLGWLDWEDRYRYLIELGEALDPIDEVVDVKRTGCKGA